MHWTFPVTWITAVILELIHVSHPRTGRPRSVRGAFIRPKPNDPRVVPLVTLNNSADRTAPRRRRVHTRCALSTVDCGIDAHSGFDG